MLVSPSPWIAYGGIHILLSALTSVGIVNINSKLIDTICPILDAVTKGGAIIAAVTAVQQHSNPAVAQSLFAQLLFGAFAPVGGATVAGLMNVWDADWHLSTPFFLKKGNTLLSTLDIWAGALSAAIYGALTAVHPTYQPVFASLGLSPKGIMTPLGARSIVVIFLTVLYSARVLLTHYTPVNQTRTGRNGEITRDSSTRVAPAQQSKKIQ